jgi:hypothetical protein
VSRASVTAFIDTDILTTHVLTVIQDNYNVISYNAYQRRQIKSNPGALDSSGRESEIYLAPHRGGYTPHNFRDTPKSDPPIGGGGGSSDLLC